MRVAVIGAGAAGLCAVVNAIHTSTVLDVVVYEKTDSLGGTWVYTDTIGTHSSMYRDMKTNLPKEIMAFPGFPMPELKQSFVHHSHVLRYLHSYARHFNLDKYIHYEEMVESVQWKETEQGEECWSITSVKLRTREQCCQLFDAVFVCNGHYFDPILPLVPDEELFRDGGGLVMHSHDYRAADCFAGLRVVCVGAGPSGIDISLEIAATAKQVFLCHEHEPLQSSLPSNLVQKRGLKRLAVGEAELMDGEVLEGIGAVLYCTGYRYSFPFLKGIRLSTSENRVTPLYMHLLHIDHPRSLFFVGLPFTVLPFPCFELQLRYAMALLSGEVPAPSKETMEKWQEDDMLHRTVQLGLRPKFAHFLGPLQWPYMNELCRLGGFANPIPQAVRALFDAVHEERNRNLAGYKEKRYRLLNDSVFECLN